MSEPRRVDARLQQMLDRAAAMQKGEPDPKIAHADAEPEAKPAALPPPRPAKNELPAPTGEAEPRSPARIHPSKRGPLVLANALTEARGDRPINSDTLSYYSPELIQATLPHSEPKPPKDPDEAGDVPKSKSDVKMRDWIRKNGHLTLIVSSGIDTSGNVLGIPYGAFPRLVLAYIISQVIANKHKNMRRVEFASRFGTFLKEVGYTGNHRGNTASAKRLKDQLNRLLKANISFVYEEGTEQTGRSTGLQMHVAPRFELWWDFKSPDQDSLFGSWIELSEDFYKAILARPVPLKTEVLKALHKDILALDVYMWVSYRLMGMKNAERDDLSISYAALQAQFGTGIGEDDYRKFRERLRKAFAKVAQFWVPPNSTNEQSLLRHEFTESGVILYRSPMLVSRGNRITNNEDAAALLAARCFDDATRKQARFLAASLYSVEHLEKQYFAWIESKGVVPANPRAHFISFVKRHVARNK